jgi:uroporphyrinogen-III synthase
LAAIGPATKEALERAHLKVDVTGDEYVAESLVAALDRHAMEGKRVLLVRAAVAREFLPNALAERGALVEVVEAYRTLPAEGIDARARELEAHPPDWITFTSSSTVENFYRAVDAGKVRGARVASIGPVTSATLRKLGIEPATEADVYTSEGLVEAILRCATGRGG